MSESVYFFDDKQQLIKIVTDERIFSDIQEKEITTTKEELLNSILSVTIEYDEELKESAFMAVRESEDFFSLYRIIKITDPENRLSFTGIDFAPDELDGYIVKDIRPANESIENVANRIIEGTEWRLGHVDSGLPSVKGSFYYISVKECLKQLQGYGCEVLFRCTLNGNGVKDKWIEIYKQLGSKSNMRYTYGEKALTVVKELDRSQVFTSVIGRGRGEEVGDGYGRRLEFSNVEWKKSNGKPLDKPKGQNWLEMPEMTKIYGIPTKKGGMRKREKVAIFDDEEDESILLEKTYSELVECSRPLVQFSADIEGTDVIGNTVTIHRYDRGYHYETRVFKLTIDRLTKISKASIGDNLTSSMSRKTSQITNGLSYLDHTKQTFFEATEIGKYQDDIMRGAGKNGGSVYQVNGLETGVSQSRETYETVYMDGPKIEESEHFMTQSSEGISFKQCKKGTWKTILDVHNGKSNTAWTLDGTFNASFIKAGTIVGIKFKTSFETSPTGLEIEKGQITFIGFDGKTKIGKITPSSSSDGEGISVTLEKGKYFSLHDGYGTPILEIPYNSNQQKPLLTTLGTHIHKGDLHIEGKLFLNGKEITGNGSGGGGGGIGGGYPPEVTSKADKFAWDLWTYLLSKGYSKAAAAGILGNVQQETGHTMDPDTLQGGVGPGYGLVQWDGSAYPLVGSPTSDGIQYVKNLMQAANITDGHSSILGQSKLIDWCMYNGQWLGIVDPTSVDGFKNMTDPRQAANTFERNFERPAAAHPERQGWAQEWYDKFKDLKPSTDGWLSPVRVGYVVTQEWDQIGAGTSVIHGGIDLAPTAGGNPEIYAAKGGTVMSVGNNPGLEGNYAMIDHGDSYYTYYGHMVDGSVRVSNGQKVTNETVIGLMGETGLAFGVHLHFEVRKGGSSANFRINPRDVIKF